VKADTIGGKKWYRQPLEITADGATRRMKGSEATFMGAKHSFKQRVGMDPWYIGFFDVTDRIDEIRGISTAVQASFSIAYYFSKKDFNMESYDLNERQKLALRLVLEEFEEKYALPAAYVEDLTRKAVADEVAKQERARRERAGAAKRIKKAIASAERKHPLLMSNCESGHVGDSFGLLVLADMARNDGISTPQYLCALAIRELCDVPDAPFQSNSDQYQLGLFFVDPDLAPMRIRIGSLAGIMPAAERVTEELHSPAEEAKSEEEIRSELTSAREGARAKAGAQGIEGSRFQLGNVHQ
jgi:hypothetical protein